MAGSRGSEGAVDESQKHCAFVWAVDRQTLPIIAVPQIGKEAGAILVEMQERLAFPIEYPWPLLDDRSGS